MKYLILMLFLIIQITAFSTDKKKQLEHDRNSAVKNMDEEIDNFDNETDEEALQKLKKKIKDKKEKSRKEKEESITKTTSQNANVTHNKSENKDELKDTTVNNQNTQEEFNNNQNYSENSNQYNNDDNFSEENNDDFRVMLTVGGGYGIDYWGYSPSRHWGIEGGLYKKNRFFQSGTIFGLGGVNVGGGVPYFSLAVSEIFYPISPYLGPFLRGDIGVMGFPSGEDNKNNDEETELMYIGIIAKAGAGFIVGNDTNGFSIQLLYTIHATTLGANNGVELQLGLHF